MEKLQQYVETVHATCDESDSAKLQQAKARNMERHRAAQIAARQVNRKPTKSTVRDFDRLHAAGLIRCRAVAGAKRIPSGVLPAWVSKLREDEIGIAFLTLLECPTAPLESCVARAKSVARRERLGMYTSRADYERRDSMPSAGCLDDMAARDWQQAERDEQQAEIAYRRQMAAREALGNKLADLLLANHTHKEASELTGLSVRTIERRVSDARRLVESLSE